MSKCCGCNKKVLSNAVANNTDSCTCSLTDNCTDVCVTPQCGDPKLLTVLVPVIYDEIGINVCRTIPLATLLAKVMFVTSARIPHNGKALVSKGTLASPEESVCMSFVSGSLLDRNIKPLELCNPLDQKRNCENCTTPDDCAFPL